MSLSDDWKRRLDATAARTSAPPVDEHKRAQETIVQIPTRLAQTKEHRCLVMTFIGSETTGSFEEMYGQQYASSNRFLGAAKKVVEYCLAPGGQG